MVMYHSLQHNRRGEKKNKTELSNFLDGMDLVVKVEKGRHFDVGLLLLLFLLNLELAKELATKRYQ